MALVTHADFRGQKRADIDAESCDEGWGSSGNNKSKIRVPGGKTVGGGLKGVAGSQESYERARGRKGPVARTTQVGSLWCCRAAMGGGVGRGVRGGPCAASDTVGVASGGHY